MRSTHPWSRMMATVALTLLVALVAAPSLAMAAVATVQGTITNTSAAPLAAINVIIQGESTATASHWDQVATAADGTYSFGVPAPGDYMVTASDPSGTYATESRLVPGVAINTTVTADITLGAFGGISGSVVDSTTAAAIQQVDVASMRLAGDFEYWDGTAQTDPYGNYTISGANPGPHAVEFSDSSERAVPYASQWFDGVTDLALATTVTVAPGAVTPGINARMVAGTNISGTVTDSGNGMPLGNTVIQILNDDTAPADQLWTSTAPDGTYRAAGLPLGTYTVLAQSQTGDYTDQSALGVVLDAAHMSRLVGFALSPTAAGYMTGRTVDASGAPIAGVEVSLASGLPTMTTAFLFSTLTAGDGTFSLPPRTGDVTLMFVDPSGAHPSLVATLAATGAGAIGDFVMGADAVISGSVTDVNSTPLASAFVRLWDAANSIAPLDSAFTGLDGHYSFGNLPAGDYKVSFDDPVVYQPEFFDNAMTFANAATITVSANGAATANAVLSKPATIQGHITALAGGPAAGATVRAFRFVSGPASAIELAGSAVTDGVGAYSITGLMTGDYVVQLDGSGFIGYVRPIGAPNGGRDWLTSHLDDADVFSIPDALNPVTVTVDARLAIDETPPVVTATVDAAHNFAPGDWYSSPTTVTITATDAVGGVDHVSYQINGGPVVDTADGVDTAQFTLVAEGHYVIDFSAVDTLGNTSATQTVTVNIDSTSPDVNATINGTPVDGWYPAATTVSIVATDPAGSGVANIFYMLDGGAQTTYTGAIPFSSSGTHTVEYWAVDNVANAADHQTVTLKVDVDPPTMPGNLGLSKVRFDEVDLVWSPSTDNESGVDFYEIMINGVVVDTTTGTTYAAMELDPDTSYLFTVTAVDKVGNRSASADIDVTTPASTFAKHVGVGANQTATFQDVPFNGGLKPFVVTFDSVTTPGTLYLTPLGSDTDLDVPAGLRSIGGYFDLDFTGVFTGNVHVTMPYDERLPDFRAQTMQLIHWVGGVPEIVDTTVDTDAHTVTFTLTSLSPILLAEPVAKPTATSLSAGWAGTSASTISPAYGVTVFINGRLHDASGVDLYDGAVVDVQRLDGANWVTIGQASRNSSGLYSFGVSATTLTNYRLSFAGDSLNDASTSPTIALYPKVKLSLNSLNSSYSHKKTYTFKGSIQPAHTVGSTSVVSIRLYRWSGGRWKLSSTVAATITGSGTTFSASIRLKNKGSWKFVPVAWADAQHAETIGSAKYTHSR